MSDVIALGIATFIPYLTFMEIDAFRRDAARKFFQRAPEVPSAPLINRLLTGAEALDDVPARFRPVTLNMLGLALQDFDQQVTSRPEQLVQDYVLKAISQPDIIDIAPDIMASMITDVGTAYPRSVPELAADTGLSEQDITACLILIARKGLVRQLDARQNLWTISHDFVARQFALLLGRLPRRRWPPIVMSGVAGLFAALLLTGVLGIPFYIRNAAFAELRSLGVNLRIGFGSIGITFYYYS
jgi:hypothetical protein